MPKIDFNMTNEELKEVLVSQRAVLRENPRTEVVIIEIGENL